MSQLSFNDFLKRVKKADRKLLEELEQMLIRSALRMERDAKKNATSKPKVQTGRLRSSITGLVDAPLGSPRVVLRAGGSSSGSARPRSWPPGSRSRPGAGPCGGRRSR